jgi:hypothetical protein
VSGYVSPAESTLPSVQFSAVPNNPLWGTVNPSNITVGAGSSLPVQALPALYFRFVNWTGDLTGTNPHPTVTVNSSMSAQAQFAEVTTANYAVPHWWLASHGITNNFESSVTSNGMNGMPIWQSYVAGLDPLDPNSRLALEARPAQGGTSMVLHWETVSGRVYSLWHSTNAQSGFVPLPGASDLPSSVNTVTNPINSAVSAVFYRIGVKRN